MIRNRIGLIDVKWSSDGDFIIEVGDMGDSKVSPGLAFLQEAEDRVKSSFNDWKLQDLKGANLEEFEGRENNQTTWSAIEESIKYSFTKDSWLDASDFSVFVAPVSRFEVGIRIDFNTALTNIVVDSKITIRVIYDLQENRSFITR